MRIRDLMFMLSSVAVTAACAGLQENATLEQAAATETVYMNGRIHTQDKDLPWAESLVTRGDRIVLVGSDEDALRYAGPDAKLVDLQGRFVMPLNRWLPSFRNNARPHPEAIFAFSAVVSVSSSSPPPAARASSRTA